MSAFVIGHIRITDTAAWERYRARAGDTIEQWDGEIVFRGRRALVFAGEPPADEVVVIRFSSISAARRWHDSPEYQSLVALRESAAHVDLMLYEA